MQDWTRRQFIATSVVGGLAAVEAGNLLANEMPAPAEPTAQADRAAGPAMAIDPSRTALLSMDYENTIVDPFLPKQPAFLHRVANVQAHARAAGIPVVHVVIRFRPGYPSVPTHGLFARVRAAGLLQEGTHGAAINPVVAPKDHDVVVTRRRVGAFSCSDLRCVLSGLNRDYLVMSGVVTSGVVLSTVRAGSDLDYQMNVIGDCCLDHDPEVHRVLTEKVFPSMAPVITAADFIAALAPHK